MSCSEGTLPGLCPEDQSLLASLRPGWAVEPLVLEASLRRYYRLRAPEGAESQVLMLIPPHARGLEGLLDRVQTRGQELEHRGIRVPACLERWGDRLLFQEDLGDLWLAEAYPRADAALRARWIDTLQNWLDLLARSDPSPLQVRLDPRRQLRELRFFWTHFVLPSWGRSLEPLWPSLQAMVAPLVAGTYAHRDFHSRNIMVLPDGNLALLDYQDALLAPVAYDRASLCWDAYIDWRPEDAQRLKETGEEDPGWLATSAQRLLKALGTFGFLMRVRNRQDYLQPTLRALRHLTGLADRLPALSRMQEKPWKPERLLGERSDACKAGS